ncbi:MAG TPA: PQQ-binding-like beta-propeller repeat protein, partial [Pirellulaceae bacterium]|nr:PQQ-binding-like beta-propeller repeat protein [Pirellulaceae bacterium]
MVKNSVAPRTTAFALLLAIYSVTAPSVAYAGDWPQWRHDAQRTSAAADDLPKKLRLAWSRQLPQLSPAWPDQPKLQFDVAYEPIVAGRRMFIGSSHDGSVAAFDSRTGDELWRFFTDGPVRFAPAAWRDRLFVASDDGFLYCLNASDGTLAWRFRGGPSQRRVLGNERVISAWPARGAPVVIDDKVYFAAGIWPFMGTFLHALDAESGKVVWTNDGDGSIYIKQPHNTDSFAGVAPQGHLSALGGKLVIPGGRSIPAGYDRATGRLEWYQLADNGKRGGGVGAVLTEKLMLNGGGAFDMTNEKYLGAVGELLAVAGDELHEVRDSAIRTQQISSAGVRTFETTDRKGVTTKSDKWGMQELGKAEIGKLAVTALIRSGSRLYFGTPGQIAAVDLPLPAKGTLRTAWKLDVPGTPVSLVAADDRLYVSTREGFILAFASPDAPAVTAAAAAT